MRLADASGPCIVVFGRDWSGELRLPQRQGAGAYFVDWVLARLDADGKLAEFTAAEVQTVDTTGNYRAAREELLATRTIIRDTVGLNWENVSKRILPQLIYKGQVLQREELCPSGLFFVCPQPVFERIMRRLGGRERLQRFPCNRASLSFLAVDYAPDHVDRAGIIRPLAVVDEHHTSIDSVKNAFSTQELPEPDVYKAAISAALVR